MTDKDLILNAMAVAYDEPVAVYKEEAKATDKPDIWVLKVGSRIVAKSESQEHLYTFAARHCFKLWSQKPQDSPKLKKQASKVITPSKEIISLQKSLKLLK